MRPEIIFAVKLHLMKLNRAHILSFILLLVVASLYRVWDLRPAGFAPQLAMAIFAGAILRDKRWAVALPLASMLLSDALYQVLYLQGLTTIPGFYEGQWVNYLLIAGLALFGSTMKKRNFSTGFLYSLSGSILFFLLSNFTVWIGGGGFNRPKTGEGLLLCYNDALAFYRQFGLIEGFAGNFILGDLFFCGVLFGSWFLLNRIAPEPQKGLA